MVQTKITSGGSIQVVVLPALTGSSSDKNFVYRLRITLSGMHSLHQHGLMQYLNFGISNNFHVLQGSDTLTCLGCERIPGAEHNAFQYVGAYKQRNGSRKEDNLCVVVTDTIAGFGTSRFFYETINKQ